MKTTLEILEEDIARFKEENKKRSNSSFIYGYLSGLLIGMLWASLLT